MTPDLKSEPARQLARSEIEAPRGGRLLQGVGDTLERAAGALCVLFFTVMIVVVGYEVVVRYIFGAPTFWSSELARWSMVWLALLGMAIAVRKLDHIRVDFLVDIAPPSVQVAMAVLRYIIAFAFAGVLLFYGCRLAIQNSNQLSPGLGLSFTWLYLAPTVSAALMLFFLAELVVRRERRPF